MAGGGRGATAPHPKCLTPGGAYVQSREANEQSREANEQSREANEQSREANEQSRSVSMALAFAA